MYGNAIVLRSVEKSNTVRIYGMQIFRLTVTGLIKNFPKSCNVSRKVAINLIYMIEIFKTLQCESESSYKFDIQCNSCIVVTLETEF